MKAFDPQKHGSLAAGSARPARFPAAIFKVVDPYVVALLSTVAVATVLPCRGVSATIFGWLANAAIILLFFLHGAKLSRKAILEGAFAWRLHLMVLGATFVLFPAIGLASSHLASPWVDPGTAAGLLFLTLLPSTVQSSIAFTAIAGGNVPAAVCSASVSNLLGIIITPALVALLMHASGHAGMGDALSAAKTIAVQLFLPFLLGHVSRPVTAGFVHRHKALTGLVDRGSILLVVYTAFSAAVVEGIWRIVSPATFGVIVFVTAMVLTVVLTLTWIVGRLAKLDVPDRIVLLFCGSKKSLASGVPMAAVLFPPKILGTVILPLMVFHQLQLIACASIARAYARRRAEG